MTDLGLPIAETRNGPPPAAPDVARRPGTLVDAHGRTIRDMRVSLTDRCNYRCTYCMDPGFRYMPKRDLLSFDEYIRVCRIARGLGVEKLRITGGEPTLHPQLDEVITAIGAIGFEDVAMTTNGSRLANLPLARWRQAGLHRLTLSLDSLDPRRVAEITRTDRGPETVVEAIALARDAGFDPIKVNAVIMRGVNDDEIADFADFARAYAIDMRLIEFMPLDSSRVWTAEDVVSADEMLAAIAARHELVPVDRSDPHGTSLNFAFADGAPGRIGMIAPVSRPFCGACSRLRITADGKIRPCLFSRREWDLRPLLRSEANDEAVAAFFVDATWTKQAGHGIGSKDFERPERTMSAIGG